MNRDQKGIAKRKRYLYEQFAILYNKYMYIQQDTEYSQRFDEHYEYTQRLFNDIRKKYGELLLFFIQNSVLEVMNHI